MGNEDSKERNASVGDDRSGGVGSQRSLDSSVTRKEERVDSQKDRRRTV